MNGKHLLWRHGIGLLLAFLIGPIVWMAVDNDPPVKIEKQWIEGDLTPGGKFAIAWQAIVLRTECDGIVRRRIVSQQSGIVFEYASVSSVILDPTNKYRTFRRELELPRSIAKGEAVHEVVVFYQCNWVQRFFSLYIRMQREPLLFTVGE